MDLPVQFVESLLARADFHGFFESTRPEAFQDWQTVRSSEEADQEVKTLARMNAKRNYQALQEIADGDELKPGERATILINLLKMSGTISDEAKVEMVKISPTHLAALRAAAAETSQN